MKKLSILVMLGFLLAGCATAPMYTPAYAQGYGPPPQNIFAAPWVGANTPWVFYNGDWFLNGMLYYFYGPGYGWAPYYAYAPTYIVRPAYWYAPRWNTWYRAHPSYWNNLVRKYPYWRGHRSGQHYDRNFYNRYHRGQGGGWHKGSHGTTYNRTYPDRRNLKLGYATPPEGRNLGPGHAAQPEARRLGTPGRVPDRQPGTAHSGINNRSRPPKTTSPAARASRQSQPGSASSGQTKSERKTPPPRTPPE